MEVSKLSQNENIIEADVSSWNFNLKKNANCDQKYIVPITKYTKLPDFGVKILNIKI